MRVVVLVLCSAIATAQTTKVNTLAKDTRACQGAFAELPYCDTTKPIDDRVNDFIARLWASPDAATIIPPQLTARHGGGGSPGPTDAVPALGLPEFDWLVSLRVVGRLRLSVTGPFVLRRVPSLPLSFLPRFFLGAVTIHFRYEMLLPPNALRGLSNTSPPFPPSRGLNCIRACVAVAFIMRHSLLALCLPCSPYSLRRLCMTPSLRLQPYVEVRKAKA